MYSLVVTWHRHQICQTPKPYTIRHVLGHASLKALIITTVLCINVVWIPALSQALCQCNSATQATAPIDMQVVR